MPIRILPVRPSMRAGANSSQRSRTTTGHSDSTTGSSVRLSNLLQNSKDEVCCGKLRRSGRECSGLKTHWRECVTPRYELRTQCGQRGRPHCLPAQLRLCPEVPYRDYTTLFSSGAVAARRSETASGSFRDVRGQLYHGILPG